MSLPPIEMVRASTGVLPEGSTWLSWPCWPLTSSKDWAGFPPEGFSMTEPKQAKEVKLTGQMLLSCPAARWEAAPAERWQAGLIQPEPMSPSPEAYESPMVTMLSGWVVVAWA